MFENREVAYTSNAQVVDEGLRSYMLKIYNYMTGGLAVTGIISYLIASNPSFLRLFFTPTGYSGFGWLALFAPLIMVFAFGWVVNKGTLAQVQAMFWGFSALKIGRAHV